MYDKDPVRARPPAHVEGWFAEETTVPLPQYIDAERDRWIERHMPRSIGQESPIGTPALRCEVQEQINPLRTPAAPGNRRVVSETTEAAAIPSRRSGRLRTLAAIPCFNEEVAIGSVVLRARQHVDEVLVIDDGCTDSTVKVARDAGATVISHGAQKGKGQGIKSALKYAVGHNYDCLVLMDGDGQHNPGEIPLLVEPILADTADLVIGFRTFDQMPFYRRFGRAVLDVASSTGCSITDSQCGFRALNRKTMESMLGTLRKDDFSTESEMLRIAQERHLRIGETPINCKYGDFDTSTKNPLSHGMEVLGSIFWLAVEKRPLLHIGLPGLAAMLAGIFLLLRFFQGFSETGLVAIEQGMLATLFLIPGTIALMLGLMLALIARMRE
ncbi:glycosyltransferase family 2 protein [Methanoculleus sp. CWC-02]|uniref:Glycosyltransferase family 2 protein n=2 Tax=Methanoculleus oceani TaxID=2184756 RepID=A0ABD4T9P5_9EURY|nr:glycosyltransferase family 2 protein [Methanoculleus sp. CWC-02]